MTEPRTQPADRSGGRKRRRSRLFERNLLRNPLPLVAAAITAFLVTLAVLAARLTVGAGSSVKPQGAAVATTQTGQAGTVLRTTASGRTIEVPAGSAGAASSSGSSAEEGSAPLRTHSSGGHGGEQDD